MNYYLHQGICSHCNKADKAIHIGKSSTGWKFNFHGYAATVGGVELTSFEDWYNFIVRDDASKIFNEYGIEIDKIEFFNMVLAKQKDALGTAEVWNKAYYDKDPAAQEAFGQFWNSDLSKVYKLDKDGYTFTYQDFC